ncbi:hypothetical protein [Streptomyces sp. NPDC060027]|uniref:hypothetical protein n=1 Tax=Streptomyces sp. NPDC060027 TaxID=3347040 RepID=UPI003692E7CF
MADHRMGLERGVLVGPKPTRRVLGGPSWRRRIDPRTLRVRQLDYVEDLYRDWNDGHRTSGGAAGRVNAEFARIRRELGDLPGITASPARLRTMLQHLTKTLHPGVLND